MVEQELPAGLLKAGKEYHDALNSLGLHPEGVLWMNYVPEDSYSLYLILSGLDEFGPLAMSRLLFQAYNASATPKEINPFIVRVVSPRQVTGKQLLEVLRHDLPRGVRSQREQERRGPDGDYVYVLAKNNASHPLDAPTHFFRQSRVYHIEKAQAPVRMRKNFRRFQDSVEKLAA